MTSIYEFEAIGTRWWLELLDGSVFDQHLIQQLDQTAAQFDQRYSRFREDSLVSELYRTGTLDHPPAEMLTMLEFAREMYDVSNGAFDITVGNTLHRLGYGKRSIAKTQDTKGFWQELVMTPAQIYYPDGVMLDFGGFGKGWLIDQFARDLLLAGKQEFIVNGGGDLYVQAKEPIRFALEDPLDHTKTVGHIDLARGALAGSDTIKRSWEDGTDKKHHIIDPATDDSSATGVIGSYVVANSARIADTMATILILRPDLETELSQHYHLQTVLIRADIS